MAARLAAAGKVPAGRGGLRIRDGGAGASSGEWGEGGVLAHDSQRVLFVFVFVCIHPSHPIPFNCTPVH